MLTLAVFSVLLIGTAAVTVAQQTVDNGSLGEDQVGICHATGSEEQPYVYMVVARDGAEHGHHAEHEGDQVDVDSPAACGIDEPAAEPSGAEPAPASEMEECHDGHGNDTAAEPSPCDGDLSVNQTGRIEGEHIFFDVVVQSLGPAEADGAKLVDRLPDVGRPWNMSGDDSAECRMVDREVRCDFGTIPSGEERVLRFKALHCPQDCGDDITNKVIVHAVNDANEANDRATAVVAIDDCPEDDWSWADEEDTMTTTPDNSLTTVPSNSPTSPSGPAPSPTTSPAPTTSSPPPASNTSAPAANSTAPNATSEPSGNETPAEEPNASSPPPAPSASDVRVRQRATQDHLGVSFVIEVQALGDVASTGVLLQNTLPDVQRNWALSGADAEDCTLDGRDLTCDFGDVAPNATKTVELRAFTDRMPCGEHLVNTVVVSADEDATASNNRSSASILARSC